MAAAGKIVYAAALKLEVSDIWKGWDIHCASAQDVRISGTAVNGARKSAFRSFTAFVKILTLSITHHVGTGHDIEMFVLVVVVKCNYDL